MTGSKAKPSKAALAGGFALPKRSATSSPTAPSTEAAETFIRGETGGPVARTSGRSSARTLTRRDGRELRRLTLYLPAELAKRLAVHAAEADRDMSEVVAEALADYLAR